ncbi:MAG: GntR family transcriptional regulator [Hamadaea sp.]|nr:GntR family transcriptional regulator [Hamadaea sp.]
MTRQTPPYLRIVDDIRSRISRGDLRPGDRIPSARQLTKDWGVAIATATKVLATLQQEGLTTVRPGVGTVVAGTAAPAAPAAAPTPPRKRADAELTHGRIVRAAIAIADADGIADLSMRRIAADLGAATMSLYRHVPGKDELILHMIDAVMGEEGFPGVRPDGWRARLELAARLQWRLFKRHPWLAPVMSLTRPQLAPNALQHTEWTLGAFDDPGPDLQTRMFVHVTMFSYVRGIATAFEPEQEARRETGLTEDEWMQSQESAFQELVAMRGAGRLKHFLDLIDQDFDFDLDKLFEFGLARMLDGLAAHLRL